MQGHNQSDLTAHGPHKSGKDERGFRPIRPLVTLAWIALFYNLAVILGGAFVRVSGAGAGCGDHWPLCNGVVAPQSPEIKTIIELSHRVTSAFSGLLAIVLLVAARRLSEKGHPVRTGAAWSLGLIIFEGLVGGMQVRLGLTADSTDPARGLVQGIHLSNTFVLVGALLLTLLWAKGWPRLKLRGQGSRLWAILLGLGALLLVGMMGAITALGDLLFTPAPGTPLNTIRNDFGLEAHFFERLRVIHPLLAIITSGYLIVLFGRIGARIHGASANSLSRDAARAAALYPRALLWLYGSVGASVVLGVLNVVLAAPAWLQLSHLLLACVMWLASTLLAYLTLQLPRGAGAPDKPARPEEVSPA